MQVFVDPHNRDGVVLPRRGELPEGLATCTAFVVDVERDGLCYSVYVRFSRFERLHAELQRELPGVELPALPQKRGPLDVGKWKAVFAQAPTDPRAIEERTAALDAYMHELVATAGVARSRALQELLALPESGESAVRHLAERAASEEEALTERLGALTENLELTNAYVNVLRAAKDRADLRVASLDGLVGASAALLGRHRQSLALGRAWRRWAGWRQARISAHEAKLRTGLTSALVREREEASVQQAAAERARAAADELRVALVAAEAATARIDAQRLAEGRRAAAALEAHVSLSRQTLVEAEEARRRAEAAARTAAAEKRRARTAAAQERATAAALAGALGEADGLAASLDERLADAATAARARTAQLTAERRRRVLGQLAAALRQHADEARLLLLLQSQRERIAATADELAALRALRADEFGQPMLEGAWLAPPAAPAAAPAEAEQAATAAPAAPAATLAAEGAFKDRLRMEWLGAMSHGM